MSEIRIRIVNIQDANSMSIIYANSWKKAYKGLLSDEYLNEIKDIQWGEWSNHTKIKKQIRII